eukprot:jgi/Psemu1/64860/estExt_Genemark1.C_880028
MATALVPSTVGNDGSSNVKKQNGNARNEKKEDDKRSSQSVSTMSHHGGLATPKKGSSPEGSVLPVNMPASMMTPNNRPPSRSSLSVQSAGSTGGRTTTSVSRRGGRTRSRSPTGHIHSYGARPPSTTPSVPSEVVPQSPRNPSAAAAAAAAAAKSFRNTGTSSGSHPAMHYQQQQQQQPPPYGGPPSMRGPPPPPGIPILVIPPDNRIPRDHLLRPQQAIRVVHHQAVSPSSDRHLRCPPIIRGDHHHHRDIMIHTTEAETHRPLITITKAEEVAPLHPEEVTNHNHHHHRHLPWDQMDDRIQEMVIRSRSNHMDTILITEMGHLEGDLLRRVAEEIMWEAPAVDMHQQAVVRGAYHPAPGLSKVGNTVDSITEVAAAAIYLHITMVVADHLLRDIHQGTAEHPIREVHTGITHLTATVNQTIELLLLRIIGVVRRPLPGDLLLPYLRQALKGQGEKYQRQALKGQGESTKSTRTVIGTATPLHLNKGGQGPMLQASAKPLSVPQQQQQQQQHPSNKHNINNNPHTNKNTTSSHDSRRGSAASVFRGRPTPHSSNTVAPPSNNPKSILDSLDTPSNSFEEKKCGSRDDGKEQKLLSDGAKDQQQLSPDDPPKIRNNNASSGDNMNFDPQPSPKSQTGGAMSPPQLTNSLDMAPSFSLFNQSFDSLGDTAQFFNVGGPLDSAMLNSSTSFELKPSGSRSPIHTAASSTDNYLQLSASNGTFKLNASMSGALFSMSPSNSFGNGPSASFSANPPKMTQVLGGSSDHGRSSPSQVLDMYQQSKSDNGGDGADLRLSASLGSPMIGRVGSYSSSRPFATGVDAGPPQPSLGGRNASSSDGRSRLSPRPQRHPGSSSSSSSQHHHQGYQQQRSSSGPPNKDGTPRFYNFLRNNKDAFLDMTFLLPKLKPVVMESKATKEGKIKKENDNTPKRGQSRSSSRYDRDPTPAESEIARRRIVSAVCAFGGSFTGSRSNHPPSSPTSSGAPGKTNSQGGSSGNKKSNSQSIFREKSGEPKTVTPNSSSSSSAAAENGNGRGSREQSRYDGALPTRYYESDNRLSWEFEENPPIGSVKDDPLAINYCRETSQQDDNDGENDTPKKKRRMDHEGEHDAADDSDDEETKGENGDASKKTKDGKGDSPKMRYRCKLCGQPKTNHVCPYQQSLVRNIGIMVHPAVNAFAASEPGKLAPALCEMNNLAISAARVQAESGALGSSDISPSRPTPDRSSVRGNISLIEVDTVSSAAQVTPETLRSGNPSRGPDDLTTPQRGRTGTPGSSVSNNRRGGRCGTPSSGLHSISSSSRKKRSHAKMSGSAGDQTDLLFVEEMELKSSQFRMVTPSKAITENPDAFTYPALPLPYAQRKRLSDNLFSLSKQIPQLTDECASILREARERDLWDLAVAELMTQVVVVVNCNEGDYCFEGLRRYLLTLGFTC